MVTLALVKRWFTLPQWLGVPIERHPLPLTLVFSICAVVAAVFTPYLGIQIYNEFSLDIAFNLVEFLSLCARLVLAVLLQLAITTLLAGARKLDIAARLAYATAWSNLAMLYIPIIAAVLSALIGLVLADSQTHSLSSLVLFILTIAIGVVLSVLVVLTRTFIWQVLLVLQFRKHTIRAISAVLLGWLGGCMFFLAQLAIQERFFS